MQRDLKKMVLGMIREHEGFRQFPYKDTVGILTVGYGRNLVHNGISRTEANYLLVRDVDRCYAKLHQWFVDWDDFELNRQAALIDMCFNLGWDGFLKFEKMIEAIREKCWNVAADEAKQSKWFGQVGKRAEEIVHLLRYG